MPPPGRSLVAHRRTVAGPVPPPPAGIVRRMVEFAFSRPREGSGLLSLRDVTAVADGLARGGLAVLPTETGPMLAALATSEAALERAFAVKGRDAALVMHVACSSLPMIRTAGIVTPDAALLLGRFTPGPLSVVIAKTPLLPDRLVSVGGTVGIRVPDHAATQQVIAAVGRPLTATSLNRSGEGAVPVDEAGLRRLDWPAGELVHVVLDPAAQRFDRASTLVRLTGEELEILRPGAIAEADLRAALAGPARS